MKLVVGISDGKVSNKAEDVIVTYSLGSCIGVILYDPKTHIGGLLHYQLPASSINPDRAQQIPCMFADTGMNWILKELASKGVNKKSLKVTLAGGAEMMKDKSMFNIGKRNHAAIRKILWTNGLFVEKEDVGGKHARTVYLTLADGSIEIKGKSKGVRV